MESPLNLLKSLGRIEAFLTEVHRKAQEEGWGGAERGLSSHLGMNGRKCPIHISACHGNMHIYSSIGKKTGCVCGEPVVFY